MDNKLQKHYLSFSQFTDPGLYRPYVEKLPNDTHEIGLLVRKQLIHRTTLAYGNKGSNADLKYGDMTKVPRFRFAEDDYFVTAAAMLAELYRRDDRGFIIDRRTENKLVLTCRFISILMASILKSKGIPTRVRSGFANYFFDPSQSSDHWINEYFSKDENRWIAIDVDGSLNPIGFDPYDIPAGRFDYSADAWLSVREGRIDEHYFHNAAPQSGLIVIAWELFYDLHCLMNNEVIYLHIPSFVRTPNIFKNIPEEELKKIDNLAKLMQSPDTNFDKLKNIWNNEQKYRILEGGLL